MEWQAQGTWTDILYETAEGIAKITINRPEVRNAFRPQTVFELHDAFDAAPATTPTIGVVILTGEGPDAFCSGGDQQRPRRRRLRRRRRHRRASTCSTCRSRSAACPSR